MKIRIEITVEFNPESVCPDELSTELTARAQDWAVSAAEAHNYHCILGSEITDGDGVDLSVFRDDIQSF